MVNIKPGDLVRIISSTSPYTGWEHDWTTNNIGKIFVVRDAPRDYYNNGTLWTNIWYQSVSMGRTTISVHSPDLELVYESD